MTSHNVVLALIASQQNLSRLAWRTAYFHRVQARHFPKSEDSMFVTQKPRQTAAEQYRMAKMITKVLH